MRPINKIIYQEIQPRFRQLALITVLIFIYIGFEALSPWPFKVLIDNVLGGETVDSATISGKILAFFTSREAMGYFIALVYCLCLLFVGLSKYFTNIATKKLSKDLVQSLGQKTFDNLERLTVESFGKEKIGDYIYHLSYDVPALGNFLENGLIPFVTSLLYLLTTALILFWLSPKLFLIATPMIPAMMLGLKIFNRKINDSTNKSEASNSGFLSFIEETLNQIKIIKAFNQERNQSKNFTKKNDVALTDSLTTYGWTEILDVIVWAIVAIGYALVITYGVKSVFLGELSTGSLIIFFFYLDNLTDPLLSLVTAGSLMREDYVKISQLEEFFDTKNRVVDDGTVTTINTPNIVFNDVSVYEKDGGIILENISLTIPANKVTALVGVSGSGKTTLTSLLLRFVEPHSGKVLIGEENIKNYSLKNLREQIAYVPQEIVLFNDSIKNNIAFGQSEATIEKVRRAAEIANAAEFIEQLPEAYDFIVGTAGTNLSGGQRQRILIARALMKSEAKILIMDEPLSALDIKTRSSLINHLRSFGKSKTTIIISNILEVVEQADFVVVLNQGKVIYTGDSNQFKEKSNIADLILGS